MARTQQTKFGQIEFNTLRRCDLCIAGYGIITMFSNLLKSFKSICFITLVLAIVLGSISSCQYRRWRDFSPVKEELPISIFGRYHLEIKGYASGAHNIYIDLSFANEITDTITLDTIPIFIIDSFCVYGDCLDSQMCHQPESWYEFREGFPDFDYVYNTRRLFLQKDLWLVNGKLKPGGYELNNILRLPATCIDSSLVLDLYVRLIDRVSNKEIANEVKRIRMLIRNMKRTYMFSQVQGTAVKRE